MSYKPLLKDIEGADDDIIEEMPTKSSLENEELDESDGRHVIHPGSQSSPEDDPAAPSHAVSSTRQRISDLFTILCAGCALISDGYANSLMTMINVVLYAQYPVQYTSAVSTRVSNALLVGEICGQITIGYVKLFRISLRTPIDQSSV